MAKTPSLDWWGSSRWWGRGWFRTADIRLVRADVIVGMPAQVTMALAVARVNDASRLWRAVVDRD